MATALEVLSLDRARCELSIATGVNDDNVLLTGHIESAVDWVFRQTGMELATTDALDVPAGLVAACVAVVRELYDGHLNWPHSRALYRLIAPYRVIVSVCDDT